MPLPDLSVAASWITHPEWVQPRADTTRLPVLRRTFTIEELGHAELVIGGVGVWTATLDGVSLSDAVIEPGVTEFRTRVAACTLDLGSRLPPGTHVLEVHLGEGPAHVRAPVGRYTKFVGTRFAPRLIAELTCTDRSGARTVISTDAEWETALGRTTSSHWYGGEDFDARIPVDDWKTPVVLGGRDAGPELWERAAPPVRVIETLSATQRTTLDDGSVLVDFGVNHAGRPVLDLGSQMPRGVVVELWPAEDLAESGHVDQTSTGKPIYDTYATAGGSARWHPEFCYHGYRYIELRSTRPAVLAQVDLTSQRMRSDNRRTGSFTCSHEMLDQIYALTDRAVQSNLFSVLTDCPHREKLGWLEQLHLVFGALAHYFDVSPQLGDMITHMIDAQTDDGLVPDIAPELTQFGGGFRDDVNWGSAIVQLPYHLWRTFGDLDPARNAWPAIERYLAYLDRRLDDGLLTRGLADWKTIDPTTPAALVHGHGYLAMLRATVELADALGVERLRYADRLATARDRLTQVFVQDDGTVMTGTQAAYALALDAGLVPASLVPAARSALLTRLALDDHQPTVGEIGLPALFRVLSEAGRDDVLLELVTQQRGPGYAHMINTGCTALAETWEVVQGEASANHFMLGYVTVWLTERIAGLRRAPSSTGWASAIVEPNGVDLLDSAEVRYDSAAGPYAVKWSRGSDPDIVHLEISVPAAGRVDVTPPSGYQIDGDPHILSPGTHPLVLRRRGTAAIGR